MSQICEGRLTVLGPTKILKEFKVADLVQFGDPKIEYESDYQIKYSFYTPNCPFVDEILSMGERYKGLVFDYYYYSSDTSFDGRYIVKDGITIRNEFLDYSYRDYGTLQKRTFREADPNGSEIVNDLIQKGVLQDLFPAQVRLNQNDGVPFSRPQEIAGSNFDNIWAILQQVLLIKRPEPKKESQEAHNAVDSQ